MPWFIGKPRLVEARQWPGGDPTGVLQWLVSYGTFPHPSPIGLHIPTREGDVMLAAPGDWIVRVMHNEFELVKAAIFEQDYEPAEPGPID